jgi:hypothetical protein
MTFKKTNKFCHVYNLEQHNELGKGKKQTYGIK